MRRQEDVFKIKMWRKAGVGAAVFSVMLTLSGCHSHQWTEADCISPRTCAECGATEGEALGHKWEEATCVLPAACSVCGATEGEPLPHTWLEANFQRPATCSECGAIEGEPWTPGFVSEGRTCCEDENTAYEYIVATATVPEEKTAGRLLLAECRVAEPDEALEEAEGYEWGTAHFEILFHDRNAWGYGGTYNFGFTDYYDIELCADSRQELDENTYQYTVNYNGEEYPECRFAVVGTDMLDWQHGIMSFTLDVAFRVPKGYDGVVVDFGDSTPVSGEGQEGLEGEPEGSKEPASTGGSCVSIRLNPYAGQDTEYPRMAVTNGRIPIQPGETLESTAVIRTDADRGDVGIGFFDFRKVGELADHDVGDFWESEPVYAEEKLSEDTELAQALDISEEGVYEVKAAVRDRNGNATTALLTILADGTAPEIHVPKEKVTLRGGQKFSLGEDVYGVDNFWASEDCLMSVDEEQLTDLLTAAQSGRAGSYRLTYMSMDVAGNIGEKEITVSLVTEGGSQGEGQAAGTGQNEAAASAQSLEDMAKEAFAIVNAYRADAGLTALVWDDAIYAATQIRAQELAVSYSHTRPDGSSPDTVLPGGYRTAGENIAFGFTGAAAVCDGWYNSPGHKSNMLNANFTNGAIACWYENGTYYWVNLFTG